MEKGMPFIDVGQMIICGDAATLAALKATPEMEPFNAMATYMVVEVSREAPVTDWPHVSSRRATYGLPGR